MAILSWPTGLRNPNSARLALAANTQSGGRSPFDATEQTLELPGARWTAELRWTNLPDGQWRIMQAFIASLGGRAGRFYWGPTHMPRRGTGAFGGAYPTITGAGQVGKVLATSGWTPGTGYAFRTGDLLGYTNIGGRDVMHMVTADAIADGAGNCSIPIAPAIRRSPPNGAALNTGSPAAIWRMSDDATGLEYERGVFASVTLQIEEAIF